MSRYYSVLVITVVVINGLHCIRIAKTATNKQTQNKQCAAPCERWCWWGLLMVWFCVIRETVRYLSLIYAYWKSEQTGEGTAKENRTLNKKRRE